MWTGEKSESGRGVWGCVPNLFFFFFPQNPADVDGDQLDVSEASLGSKMLEKKFFSRARESSFGSSTNYQFQKKSSHAKWQS